jgi:hypothetical protein
MGTEYKGLQSVLNASLGDYHSKGFSLTQEGDHIVSLYHQDTLVGHFSQSGATIESIRSECQDYLDKNHLDNNNGHSDYHPGIEFGAS